MSKRSLILPAASQLAERAKDFGFRKASATELRDGLKLAESLMGMELAAPEEVERMDRVTGYTSWVTGNPVEGIFLTIPLSKAGALAVRNGTYSPGTPDGTHLCPEGGECHGVYIGVYAGATHEARKSIMVASATLRFEMFAQFPCFARGATEDGVRSMKSLGFVAIEGGLPDLFVQEAIMSMDKAA